MEEQEKNGNKMILWVVAVVVVLLMVVAGTQIVRTTPDRTLDTFLTAIEEGDRGTAMALVNDGIATERRENIAWFVDDWTSSETVTYEITKEEAWRQRFLMEKNESGEEVNVLNEHGDRDREIEPTPGNFAGFYHAEVNINYDSDIDPVIITLRRKGENRWSRLGTTFRGWEIVRVQYQPFDGSEFDDFGDQFFEFDGEGELEYEIDENGNLVLPDEEGLILEDGSTEKDGTPTPTEENTDNQEE
jgi:hypothetical protein